MNAKSKMKQFRIAIAQLPITGDPHEDGEKVRKAMREAAKGSARLIQFPEGMLSGYAKNPIQNWDEVDWDSVRAELESIMVLAAKLKLWVVLGSTHQLTPPHWPHNSLYIISDEGTLVNRYDKRVISHTEVTQFYTPGHETVTFDVDGFRFGCLICVEVNFPALFMEYARLNIDCLLLSAYPEAEIFYTKARAHAAIHTFWIGLSVPTERKDMMHSTLINPNGEAAKQVEGDEGILVAEMDRTAPEYDIALNKAKPWRASVTTDEAYIQPVNDPRSVNRTCL